MTNLDIFLNKYLRLESAIKQNPDLPDTVLDYESTLDQDTAEKMRLCRIIRNYCRHHDDYKKFVEINSGMISFLESQINSVESYLTHVKDAMKRIKPVSISSNLKTMTDAVLSSRLEIVPVEDDSGVIIALIGAEAALQMISLGTARTPVAKVIFEPSVKNKWIDYTAASADDLLETYNSDNILLVYAKEKYKGIVRQQK